ncbi:MAG: WYL domain-containing protein, partial [Vampirovibrionia bacterium]
HQYLRVDRIEEVSECDFGDIEMAIISTKVKFMLYGIHAVSYQPEENEIILDRDDKSITIESQMKNKFKLVQKVLSFGKDCEVVEPREIQEEIISKLKLMSELYKNDNH